MSISTTKAFWILYLGTAGQDLWIREPVWNANLYSMAVQNAWLHCYAGVCDVLQCAHSNTDPKALHVIATDPLAFRSVFHQIVASPTTAASCMHTSYLSTTVYSEAGSCLPRPNQQMCAKGRTKIVSFGIHLISRFSDHSHFLYAYEPSEHGHIQRSRPLPFTTEPQSVRRNVLDQQRDRTYTTLSYHRTKRWESDHNNNSSSNIHTIQQFYSRLSFIRPSNLNCY